MTLPATSATPLLLPTTSCEGPASPLLVAGNSVSVGVSSWTDRSLTQEASWYPKRTMKAAERMAYYADRFPLVEMETTYRFPPTVALAQQWIDRTPENFRFDIQAWSLLTGQPTIPTSLFEDLAGEVNPMRRDNRRLYLNHLSKTAIEQCWTRFCHSLAPLIDSGRLGTIIFRYPRWFSPRDENRDTLVELRARMADLPVAVQFSNPDWVQAEFCESTFCFLEDLDLSFVCVDANDDDPRGLSGAAATTSDIGVVRLLGRRQFDDEEGWSPDWRGYRYSEEETERTAERLEYLASGCKDLHVIFSTTWRDDSVVNAGLLRDVLETRNAKDLHLP